MTINVRDERAVKARARGAVTEVEVDGARLVRNLVFACMVHEILLLFLDGSITDGGWIEAGPIQRLFDLDREESLELVSGDPDLHDGPHPGADRVDPTVSAVGRQARDRLVAAGRLICLHVRR
ncbi:MAG: hypothetical protein R3231_07385 [bacterium]|nr:hypothetical protein [bacterium]